METNNEIKKESKWEDVGQGYLVLSIKDLRYLLEIAKEKSKRRRGRVAQESTIVLSSILVRKEGREDIQFPIHTSEVV